MVWVSSIGSTTPSLISDCFLSFCQNDQPTNVRAAKQTIFPTNLSHSLHEYTLAHPKFFFSCPEHLDSLYPCSPSFRQGKLVASIPECYPTRSSVAACFFLPDQTARAKRDIHRGRGKVEWEALVEEIRQEAKIRRKEGSTPVMDEEQRGDADQEEQEKQETSLTMTTGGVGGTGQESSSNMRKGEVGADMGSTISSAGSRMTTLGVWPRFLSPTKVHGKGRRRRRVLKAVKALRRLFSKLNRMLSVHDKVGSGFQYDWVVGSGSWQAV